MFNRAAGTKDNEMMYCVSPLGYPVEKMPESELKFRAALHADERMPEGELFFEKDFTHHMSRTEGVIANALEAVKLSPSATNRQPWRIVKDGNSFHFYEHHAKGLASRDWDVQRIDMGIALNHFMSVAGGSLSMKNPGIEIPDDTDYIATVEVNI